MTGEAALSRVVVTCVYVSIQSPTQNALGRLVELINETAQWW
jgi:hypothetical protein